MQVFRGGAQLSFEATEMGHVGACRRAAQKLAEAWKLGASCVAKVAVVASELATNLVKYGRGGKLLIQPTSCNGSAQIEMLAIDQGPGMDRVDECMRDGYSTGGTLGTGLGAVRRMAAIFDIYSMPGKGTVVFARVGEGDALARLSPTRSLELGMICLPIRGEVECGDTWSVAHDNSVISLLVVDGLGHGPLAAIAAAEAANAHAESPFHPPQEIMRTLHRRLAGTRGAAAACAVVDESSSAVHYAGIGNISGRIVSAQLQKGLLSHNGTLGMILPRSQGVDYDWPPGSLLIMHSDGLSARWSLADYSGLTQCHPAVIAAALLRDFSRGSDDSTVVVVRRRHNEP